MDENKKRPPADALINVNGVDFSHQDIFSVVDDFYTQIQQDEVLKVPFASVVDWPEHVERLTHFWWIRFGGEPYMFSHYNPVGKHFYAGFNSELLERWLKLFHQTLKKYLQPDQIALWKLISERMGESLTVKNDMLKHELEKSRGK